MISEIFLTRDPWYSTSLWFFVCFSASESNVLWGWPLCCNMSLWFFVCLSVSKSNVLWGGSPKAHAVTRLYGSFFVCLFQRRTLCGADVPRTMLWHSLMRGTEFLPSFTPGLGTQKLPIRFDTDTCPRVQRDGKMAPSFIPGLGMQTPPPPIAVWEEWPEFDCPEVTLSDWQDIKIQLLLLI